MKRVLVPVDGSDCSLRAVDYVVGDRTHCAAADGYEVHLLNVQAPLPRDVTQFVGHAQVADFHRAESERALQPAEAALVKAGVPFTSHAEVGHIGETIAQRADDLGVRPHRDGRAWPGRARRAAGRLHRDAGHPPGARARAARQVTRTAAGAASGIAVSPAQGLRGVLSPVVTPFTSDLRPDAARLARHCRWLLASDVGLAVFGTNSEGNSLTVAEKLALLDALVEAGIPAARMMPGTGTCALPDTVELTRRA